MGQRRGNTRRDYRRINRRKQRNRRLMLFGLVLLGIIFAIGVIKIMTGKIQEAKLEKLQAQVTQENGSFIGAPPFDVNLLDVNEYSRPGIPLIGDRVVLKQLVAEETTKSGIVLPGQAQEKPQQAEVVAVGPGGVIDGKEIKMEVAEGDQVIYSKYAGTEVKLDGEEYIIVKQSDILAVVK